MQRYQNTNKFFQKYAYQICLKKNLLSKMLKILYREHMLLKMSRVKKLQDFLKEGTSKNQSNRVEDRKGTEDKKQYASNGRDLIIHLTAGLIKKI